MAKLVVLGAFGVAFVLGSIACGGSNGADGATGPAGPQGAPGPTGPTGPSSSGGGSPSVSAITPAAGFLARTMNLEVAGYATMWSATTTVDFGMGIKVNKVTPASATGLLVNVTIDPAAALGPRDVTVTDGTSKETYAGAFQIVSPAELTLAGTQAQGSILMGHIKNRDFANPFDTTSQSTGLFGPTIYTNIAWKLPMGVNPNQSSQNVTPYSADELFLVDVMATTGMGDATLTSGPPMDPTDVAFPMPAAMNLTARTATALVDGTPAMGNTAKAFDTALYSFTPGASLSILDFAASSAVMGANPQFAMLPKSGAFADLIAFGPGLTLLTQATDPYYLVVWDNTGSTGAFTLSGASTAPAATLAETEPNDAKNLAQAITATPFALTGGQLSMNDNQDWFRVTVAQADVGKGLHVQFVPGDPQTDATVTIYLADGVSVFDQPQIDQSLLDFQSMNFANPGTYYVVVSTGQSFVDMHGAYQMVVRLK